MSEKYLLSIFGVPDVCFSTSSSGFDLPTEPTEEKYSFKGPTSLLTKMHKGRSFFFQKSDGP